MPKSFLFNFLSNWFVPQRANNHRPKLLHPESLLILALVVAGFFSLIQTVKFFPSLQNSILGFATNISVEEVLSATNAQRAQLGLAPLTLNTQLSAAALAKAQDMLDNQYWAHTSPQGKQPWDFIKAANYSYKLAGENLARDFYHTQDMVDAWMASPTHRDNIVNSQYEQMGLAVVNGKLEGFETTLVVQLFGTPASTSPLVSKASAQTEIKNEVSVQTPLAETEDIQAPIHNPVIALSEQADKKDIVEDDSVSKLLTSDENGQAFLEYAVQPLTHLDRAPLFNPLQLTKIGFLAVILLILATLVYDSLVIGNKSTMRLVGKNLAHIILFAFVGFMVFVFKGGMIQ